MEESKNYNTSRINIAAFVQHPVKATRNRNEDRPAFTEQAKKPGLSSEISRRAVLGSAVSATSYALLPLSAIPVKTQAQELPQVLSSDIQQVLNAFVDRIIPADENGPGALQAGVAGYINRALSDWIRNEQPALSAGLESLNTYARQVYDSDFAALNDAQKDELISAMDAGQAEGFSTAQQVFNRLHRLTLEGMFSDPYYGGNQNYIGWDLIGYPGAVMASNPEMQRMGGRLPPLHTSAYGSDFDGDQDGD